MCANPQIHIVRFDCHDTSPAQVALCAFVSFPIEVGRIGRVQAGAQVEGPSAEITTIPGNGSQISDIDSARLPKCLSATDCL